MEETDLSQIIYSVDGLAALNGIETDGKILEYLSWLMHDADF